MFMISDCLSPDYLCGGNINTKKGVYIYIDVYIYI